MQERDWLQNIRELDSQAKQVTALEEIARGAGFPVEDAHNQLKAVLHKTSGILVTDEKIFELAKLYLGYGLYAPGVTALPLADVSVFPNFSCDQLFESILSQTVPGAHDPNCPPMQNLFSAIRSLQQTKSAKPTIGAALLITFPIDPDDAEWLQFFGGLRMLLTLRDLKLIVLCSRFDHVPSGLAKLLTIFSATLAVA